MTESNSVNNESIEEQGSVIDGHESFDEEVLAIKVKPLSEYCNIKISQLVCDMSTVQCMLAKAKERLIQAKNCNKYNWDTKQKPKMVAFWSNVVEKLTSEFGKMDVALKQRKSEIDGKLPELNNSYNNRYIPGWEPEGWKPGD